MKKTIGMLLVLTGLATAVFAQESSSESTGIFGKIAEGFSTSTSAAHELFKENNSYAMNIGTETYAAAKEDTKERLSKGFKQGFVDEINKQKHNRKAFQEAAISLHGTRQFASAQREFSHSIPKYTFPEKL